jgi:signal transduction histidine kinase
MPDLILEQLASVVEYSSAAVYAVGHNDLHLLASRGLEHPPEVVKMTRLRNQPALNALAANEKPLVIPDLQRDTTFVRAVRDAFGQQVRSSGAWIGVPLVTPSTVGLLVAEHFQPGYFSAEKADLVVAFADQAAGAIESAQLYEQARQRVAEAESLRRVTLALVQKHTLEELLAVICREACGLIGAAASVIFLKEEENRLRLAYRDTLLKELSDTIPMATTHTGRAIQRGQALVVNERDEYLSHTTHIDPSIETLLVIPLRVEQEIIGALDMINKPQGFTDDDVRTINHFADAAALAIERARLQRQAEQLAVMRERQRLARELHDSVTQALYSLSLHTRAIQMALRAGDDASAMESIEEMRDVAREATLGMRRLIFELRPPALEKEGLVNALKMRLAAVEARAGLQTEMKAGDDLELPYAVEEELYWIASEALNNIVKHARAERVTIILALEDDEQVRLSVEDDGIGVDPEQADVGGGIGFRGMAERAEKIQGKLHVDSLAHGGTRVTVTAGLRQRRSEQ